MELLGCSKWDSSLKDRHGGHVCPIVENILLRNINTLLQEVFKRRGETRGIPCKG